MTELWTFRRSELATVGSEWKGNSEFNDEFK
jgi:hypothetical protein